MTKKYAIWLAVIALLAAAGIVVFVLMKQAPVNAPVAEIIQNGKVIRTVPLSEDTEFVVTCAEGSNTVTVRDGKIMISSADCPDKVCVRTGAINSGAVPIVCLPHRLEIKVKSEDDIDAAI